MASLALKSQILRTCPPDASYLIGVSGGRDSVSLLRCLVDLGYDNMVVCHLDHQLRGRASKGDARLVQKLAAKYGVELESASTNVRALAAKKKLSVETAAREARYLFFAQVAKRRKCSTIFVAHHADDLVETFLINLFRGAATGGLMGIRERSTRRISGVDLVIVRPLLGVWRSEIDQYVRAHRLDFREDPSNKDLTPLRNRLRRRVIPYLEKALGRNIRGNIWRTAMIVADEECFFESLMPPKAAHPHLIVDSLRQSAPAMQRRLILQWLRTSDVSDVGFDLVERVRALLDVNGAAAKTNLPGDRHVRRRAGRMFIE